MAGSLVTIYQGKRSKKDTAGNLASITGNPVTADQKITQACGMESLWVRVWGKSITDEHRKESIHLTLKSITHTLDWSIRQSKSKDVTARFFLASGDSYSDKLFSFQHIGSRCGITSSRKRIFP